MSRSEIRKLGANGPAWLKVFPQLRDTDDPVLLQAAREAQPVSWSKGEYVFHEGDPCEQFVFALSGTTRVFKHESSGKQITLYRVNPGQSCAMTTACLLTGRPYQASATVESKVNATILSKEQFQHCIAESPHFRRFVFSGYGEYLSELMKLVKTLTFERIDVRLARYLHQSSKDETTVKTTHQSLAFEIGTVREVVTRELNAFKERGWVRVSRGRIDVTDRDAIHDWLLSNIA